MAKYFKNAFAKNGDKEAVPDDSISTLVSYETGYTPEYELNPDTDPNGNYVGRRRFNQLFADTTENIKQWQDYGYPEFVADDGTGSPLSYQPGRIVYHSGAFYQANTTTNTAPPSAQWDEVSLYGKTAVFGSVADMVASDALVVGMFARTLGYYTPGDGGGNDYEIVAAGTGTDDGGSFIDLTGSGLQAKRLLVGMTVKTSTGEQTIAEALDNRVISVDTIADLLALPEGQRKEGLQYLVKEYHAGSSVGGGEFYLDADRPASDHNGGTVIAIEKEFPADWSDLPTVISWFTPPTSGSGCFVASKVDPSRVATAEFGVRYGVSHSQRPAYQAALDATGLLGGGVVSSGFDLINLDARAEDGICLQVPNNVWIDNRGCELRIIPNNFAGYSIARFSEDITDSAGIFGGKIIGDKHTHLGSSGEWGMGVDIRGASRVVVRDIEVSQCWGDGIYIGDNGAAPAIKTGHVLLDNVVCDDNRRQGLSITNAVKVVITYGEFTNTSGTPPESGIVIEPNLGAEITEVEFGTVVCSGNAGFGFLTIAPFTPSKIGKITGQRIIANSNNKAGVSVETTDEFYCAHVSSEGNGGSGLDIVTVGKSDIRLLDCRDNGSSNAIRNAAVNYRNVAGERHSVGRMSIQGGSPANFALTVYGDMGTVFECDSMTVNGVNHSSASAVNLIAPSGEAAIVNIGSVTLSDLPNGGLSVGAGVVSSIGSVTLDNMDTVGTGTRYGVHNASAQARFGSIYAGDGSNLYHVLRNTGDRSIFSSVVASPAALNGAGAAILDTSTGSIVATQILS